MGIFQSELKDELIRGYHSKLDSTEKKQNRANKHFFKIETYLLYSLKKLMINPTPEVCDFFYDILISAILIEKKDDKETLRNERRKKGSYIKLSPLRSTLNIMLYYLKINSDLTFKINNKNNCTKTIAAIHAYNLVSIALGQPKRKSEEELNEESSEIKSILRSYRKNEKYFVVTENSIFFSYDIEKKDRKGKIVKKYKPG